MGYQTRELFIKTVDFVSNTLIVEYTDGQKHEFRPVKLVARENDIRTPIDARTTITILDEFQTAYDFVVGRVSNNGTVFANYAAMLTFFEAAIQMANAGGGGGGTSTSDATAANQVTGNISLASIDGKVTDTNTKLDAANTSLDNIETATGETSTKLDTANTALVDANNSLDAIEASTGSIDTKLDTTNTALADILAEQKDDQGISVTKWLDANGVNLEKRTIINQDSGAITTVWVNAETNAPATPAFPLSSISATATKAIACFIDDQNSDGLSTKQFVRFISIAEDGTPTVLGSYEMDYVTPYVPSVTGTVYPESEFGGAATTKWGTLELSGVGSWSPTALVRSATYFVVAAGGTPTITDSSLNTRPLRANENGTFPISKDSDLMDISPVINSTVGDVIIINFTTL